MKRFYFLLLTGFVFTSCNQNLDQTYQNTAFYEVIDYTAHKSLAKKPKNIIFLIGDGMGPAQIYSGHLANKGALYLNTFPVVGVSKTSSSDKLITDSASGATAFSTGVKTYNGAIGVDPDGKPVKTILEEAEENGLSTGLVATCGITHATPASFISHQESRNMYEEIAADFLKTDIDVFIGGYRDHFSNREDGQNLLDTLEKNGYSIVTNTSNLKSVEAGKIVGLISDEHQPSILEGRGNMLEEASDCAIRVLQSNEEGFFLMIEGSQIDWGGHDNDIAYVVTEMLDFDQVVGDALRFAAEDGETLVVVTADHETGGMAIAGGNVDTGEVTARFTTGGHTPINVPVYAYGPGAEKFSGTYENTEIYFKFKELLGFQD